MNIKPTFFTSDWHIGHENCIKYDERPYETLDAMHEALIRIYNSTVPDSGICYFLGDMGNKTEDMRKVISQLKGTKVLILGNHDKGITTMYNCGFDVVLYSASIYIGKERVTMTHCPLRGVKREDVTNMRGSNPGDNWHGESREKHKMCSITDEGQYHIHGHTHNREGKDSSVKILGKQFDIGVTCNKYTPVSISQIESWISNDIKSRK